MSKYLSNHPSTARALHSAAEAAQYRWDTLSGPARGLYRVLVPLAVVAAFVVPSWAWLGSPLAFLPYAAYAALAALWATMVATVGAMFIVTLRESVADIRESVREAALRRAARVRWYQRTH